MDETQMRERCPGAALIGTATLKNYRLAFTIFSPKRQCGCADIVRSPGDSIYGLLYSLPEVDLAALDVFEGCPAHYQRTQVQVEIKGALVLVHSYEVVEKQNDLRPSKHYLGLIRDAAARHSFPEHYQAFLQTILPCD